MDDAGIIRILKCAEAAVSFPDFKSDEERNQWALTHLGQYTFREVDTARKIIDLLEKLDG
ncbi:hypothetical protein [Shinella sp. JR1-6]|uniref:hypothetical protein n=1 Tax=Shinella sp. JR1-6 TaxID=2527671 RepID=UPI00102D4AF2|nr:hypothetical protein [Shinella sp. JR1-6]TAA54586.1 hypothetical protein EXZ48_26540 [Shinella sp. JR1-6]